MNLYFLRFMLFCARFEHALAVLGNNRERANSARRDEVHWQGELAREELLRSLDHAL